MRGAVDAYWLEQTEANVPAGNQWLSAAEVSRLAGLRFAKRRADWRLGRWTAKRAVASCLNLSVDVRSLEDIEIRPTLSGAPEVFLFNQSVAMRLSLSHRAGTALCVVGFSGASLGCDLELVEFRDHSFVTDFFTANEQRLLGSTPADEQSLLETLLWSAKESALKALRLGLRLDTTRLEVSFSDGASRLREYACQNGHTGWSSLVLRCAGEHIFRGWWRCAENMVRTVVFDCAR